MSSNISYDEIPLNYIDPSSNKSNIKPNNVVSIENLDDLDNYVLKAPKKGRIYKGANWTAYNRENLGSIPLLSNKSENVLINNNPNRLGFNTQSDRFCKLNDSIRLNYPGPGSYSIPVTTSSSTINMSTSSKKGEYDKFLEENKRFDDPKLYYEKFYPGPGKYDSKTISELAVKNDRYKALFNHTYAMSLKMPQDKPGPGCYDFNLDKIKYNKDYLGFESNFKSTSVRFKNKSKIKNLSSQIQVPGPGQYFINTVDKIETDNKKSNFFFSEHTPKEENLLSKYLMKRAEDSKSKTYNVPGPGSYELSKPIGKEYKEQMFYDNNSNNLMNKKTEKLNETDDILLNKIKPKINEYYSTYKKPVKDSYCFLSKRHEEISKLHVPGPAYYSPNIQASKSNFNRNDQKLWI